MTSCHLFLVDRVDYEKKMYSTVQSFLMISSDKSRRFIFGPVCIMPDHDRFICRWLTREIFLRI